LIVEGTIGSQTGYYFYWYIDIPGQGYALQPGPNCVSGPPVGNSSVNYSKSLGGGSGSASKTGNPGSGSGSGNRGCPPDNDTTNSNTQQGQYGGDPINETTGNVYEVFNDYGGYGPCPLVFNRYYNSLGTRTAPIGVNWSHRYSASIIGATATTVVVIRPDQRQLTFSLKQGRWSSDADVNDRLVEQTTSSGVVTGWVLTTGSDNVETYNASGTLLSIATRSGLTQTLSYNGLGQLVRVTDQFGHALSFTYDSNHRLFTMTDPAGRVTTYAYDSNDNLKSVTWPGGSMQQYLYENASLPNCLTGIIDESGVRFATFSYNSNIQAITSTLAGGVSAYAFSYSNGSTTTKDALGRTTTFDYTQLHGIAHTANVIEPLPSGSTAKNAWTYDTNGNVTSYTDFNGNKTSYSYDLTRNLLLKETRADGRVTNITWSATHRLPGSIVTGSQSDQRTYDAKGNLLHRVLSDTSISYSRIWTYTYNSFGQPLTVTDPNDHVTHYAYTNGNLSSLTDPLGHITKYTYDAEGKRLTMSDPNGLVTKYAYDIRGRLITVAAGSETTSYRYDPIGNLISVAWPSGYSVTNTYDVAHRLVGIKDVFGNQIKYTLDLLNNRTAETHTNASGSTVYSHTWTYDVLNRVAESIGASGHIASLTYDPNGNLVRVLDPLGHLTQLAYDSINRMSEFTAADGGHTRISYDEFDYLVDVTDPRGAATTYSVDALGNTRGTNSPDAGHSTSTPDAVGNVVKGVDANGHPLAYSYDALNRLVHVSRSDTNTVLERYTYDQTDAAHSNGVGRLTSMTDPSGTTNWSYDINGHVLKKTQVTGGFTLVTSYGYDLLTGNLSSVVLPSGATLRNTWANGRIANVAVSIKGVTTAVASGLQYEPFSGPTSWTLGNGESDHRHFDLDGRVTADGVDSTISYDAASRISGVTLAGSGGSRSYQYDAVGRLTRLTSTVGTQPVDYLYDLAGNRVRQSIGSVTTSYAFPAGSNRLLSASSPSSTTAYSYDADGSRVSEGSTRYTYDVFERLTTAVGPNGNMTYVHNGFGQRVVKYGKTPATYFVYDEAGHLVGEYNSSGQPLEETLYLGDMPIAVVMPTGIHYVRSDYRNTPRQIDNMAKVAVWSWDARGFGDTKPLGTTLTYNLRFPGQYYDGETVKNYSYFRTYDPMVGRYLETDPLGLLDDANLYAYVRGNPVLFTDPFGLLCTYSQSSGQMSCFNDGAGQPYYNQPGGYSGAGAGRNNPNMQNTPNVGPIPQGSWRVGPPYNSPNTGPNTIPLTPLPGNQCASTPRDCTSFRIHGNNSSNDASTGCIILPPGRTQIPPGETVNVVP
jgi:RHS repeat-associated protein